LWRRLSLLLQPKLQVLKTDLSIMMRGVQGINTGSRRQHHHLHRIMLDTTPAFGLLEKWFSLNISQWLRLLALK
jgi:hypothetical protein